MKFGAVENKARIAVALFLMALLLIVGMSLALYFQARRELAGQRLHQAALEAVMLASLVSADQSEISDDALKAHLTRNGIRAAGALFSTDGRLIARASTIEPAPDIQKLTPRAVAAQKSGSQSSPQSTEPAAARSEGGFDVAEWPASGSRILVIAHPIEADSSPLIFYVFSYQLIALAFGLGLTFLLVRWLLRPYRRMVEAARGSPVLASTARSESEFVVETFQALIDQLQAKEKELAQLHAIERKRAEKSERFSEKLIGNIPSGLVAVDSKGVVTSINAQASEIFGPVESAGQRAYAGSADGDLRPLAIDYRAFFATAPKMIEMICECLSSGASYRREVAEVIHPEMGARHLGLSISPISDASHELEGALCLMTDITEIIDLRERMKVQENLANLGEMAAGLAHEFKNSLATIYGYIQLLDAQSKATATSAERTRTLGATLNEVRLLTRLVTDFLNFARPQQLSLTQIDLRSIIEASVEEVRPRLKQGGIELRIEGRFAKLPGDESLLKRAFVNLLRNAIEAIDLQSPRKLIEVTGSIDTATGGRYAHVLVADTGGGISTGDLHRIFIPFFTTKSRGYGIGLALVQKIIVAHGGSVFIERSDGSGTAFHCRLPLVPPPPAMEQQSQDVD